MRRAARRDLSEPAIISTLEAHGWAVVPMSGPGLPDLMAFRRGVTVFLECKTGKGRLTPAQVALHLRLKANGVRVAVVRTPGEALAAVGVDVRRTDLEAKFESSLSLGCTVQPALKGGAP